VFGDAGRIDILIGIGLADRRSLSPADPDQQRPNVNHCLAYHFVTPPTAHPTPSPTPQAVPAGTSKKVLGLVKNPLDNFSFHGIFCFLY